MAGDGLFRTFIVGILLGALGTGALAWYVPIVDLHRERSMVSVMPNGGNVETFTINLPRDRILVGLPNADNSIPAGLDWPGDELAGDMLAEIFKIRDTNNTVIGVGSRLASSADPAGPFIEWALHFPARGTMYVKMEVTPSEDGVRNGELLTGTRDFEILTGGVRESFIAPDGSDPDEHGQIQLQAALVGQLGAGE
jgi:hypothetical protein